MRCVPGYLYLLLLCNPVSLTGLMAEEARDIEEIVVTAKPIGLRSSEHLVQPISVLNKEELDKVRTASIGETLARVPGVNSSEFGLFASRPIIRGLGGPRVRILQDGIGTLDVATTSIDHAVTIEPFQTRQIEIFRGPATLLYGSGASGGLVNIVTGRIPDTVPDDFTAGAETRFNYINQEKAVTFRLDGGVDNLVMHLDGTHRDANNYDAAEFEVQNSGYDNTNINFGSSLIGARGFAGFSFGTWDSIHEVPLNPVDPEFIFIDTDQKRFDFAARIDDPVKGFSHLKLRGAYNDYHHIEFEGPGMPGTEFSNDEWENRIELTHLPISGWTGAIGSQFGFRSFKAIGDEAFLPPVDSYNFAFFVLEDIDLDNWHFDIGGRFEHKQYIPVQRSGFLEISFDVYSIASSLSWHINDRYALGLSISRTQRAPSEEELYTNGPHLASGTFEIGDPDLEKETSNNLDISFGQKSGNLNWSLNLFVNYIEDFIYLEDIDSDGDGQVDRVDEAGMSPGELIAKQNRQDNAIFYGIEAETSIDLVKDTRGELQLRFFGDYVRGKIDGGDNLERINPPRIGTGLEYTLNRWNASLDFINVFKQNDTGPLETVTGGYTLLDMQLTQNLSSSDQNNLVIFLKGTNLLDQDARRHTSFLKDRAPLPGRSVMIGIRAEY